MTVSSVLAMLAAMAVLAAVPDASAAAVVGRSLSCGVAHGLAVIAGIIVGDLIFIAVVFSGLAAAAETMSGLFVALALAGSVFLLWLGVRLLLRAPREMAIEVAPPSSGLSDFTVGLLITLGDAKAIGFYVGFLPAYLAMDRADWRDAGIVLVCAILAVGGIKGAYAYAAGRARALLGSARTLRRMNVLAGLVMLATAALVLVKLL